MAVPMANGPPFATLNHVAADLGIPNESEPLRVGISDSLSSPTTGEGGNHGCEGDFGKEVCCEAERRRTRTAWNIDSERKEPGAPGTEGADLVEGRCLGSWQRVERQPDHRSSGNQRRPRSAGESDPVCSAIVDPPSDAQSRKPASSIRDARSALCTCSMCTRANTVIQRSRRRCC